MLDAYVSVDLGNFGSKSEWKSEGDKKGAYVARLFLVDPWEPVQLGSRTTSCFHGCVSLLNDLRMSSISLKTAVMPY